MKGGCKELVARCRSISCTYSPHSLSKKKNAHRVKVEFRICKYLLCALIEGLCVHVIALPVQFKERDIPCLIKDVTVEIWPTVPVLWNRVSSPGGNYF